MIWLILFACCALFSAYTLGRYVGFRRAGRIYRKSKAEMEAAHLAMDNARAELDKSKDDYLRARAELPA